MEFKSEQLEKLEQLEEEGRKWSRSPSYAIIKFDLSLWEHVVAKQTCRCAGSEAGSGGGDGILFPNERGNGGDTPSRLLFCILRVSLYKKKGTCLLLNRSTLWLCSRFFGFVSRALRLLFWKACHFVWAGVRAPLQWGPSTSCKGWTFPPETGHRLLRMFQKSRGSVELIAEAFISFALHLLAPVRFTTDIYDLERLYPTQLGDLLTVPPSHSHIFFFCRRPETLVWIILSV